MRKKEGRMEGSIVNFVRLILSLVPTALLSSPLSLKEIPRPSVYPPINQASKQASKQGREVRKEGRKIRTPEGGGTDLTEGEGLVSEWSV